MKRGQGRAAALKKKSCRLERGQEGMHRRDEEQRRLKGAERTEKERGEGWGREQRGQREPQTPSCGVKERVEDEEDRNQRRGISGEVGSL